jgi:hypothetical protein
LMAQVYTVCHPEAYLSSWMKTTSKLYKSERKHWAGRTHHANLIRQGYLHVQLLGSSHYQVLVSLVLQGIETLSAHWGRFIA